MKRQKISNAQGIFENPENIRKNLEHDRRLLRLQQVRVQSNNIAKKVRENVEKEKMERFKELDLTRAKEYENWRSQVHAKVHQNCQNSMFQIGAAQAAALVENNRKPKTKITPTFIKKKANTNQVNVEKENLKISNTCKIERKRKIPTKNIKIHQKKTTLENKQKKEKTTTTIPTNKKPDSSSNSVCCGKCGGNLMEEKKNLPEMQPVVLEIKGDSCDSTEAASEIKDNHTKINRQFDRCVHWSPKRQSDNIPRPRYTQISDFVKKTSISNTCTSDTMEIASDKTTQSNLLSSNLVKSLPSIGAKAPDPARNSGSTTSIVQFYDYNNKFGKQYEQPPKIVNVNKKDDHKDQGNANENALSDLRSISSRAMEKEILKAKSEERCQKALEREQVQRDYNALTEKLDALMNQGLTMPIDEKKFSHRYQTNLGKQRESNLINAVEEILKRPAIITCDEVEEGSRDYRTEKCQRSSDINLGITENRSSHDFIISTSDESCCSLLLGYANEQSKLISNDIKKFDDAKDESLKNKYKIEKLQRLLKRVEALREHLIKELHQNGTSSDSSDKGKMQDMFKSIKDLSKERTNILSDHASSDMDKIQENQYERKKNKNQIIVENNIEQHHKTIDTNNPLEIIIKVQTEKTIKKRFGKVSTSIRSPLKKRCVTNRETVNENESTEITTTESILCDKDGQMDAGKTKTTEANSYFTVSTSTSYCSLPKTLANNIDPIMNEVKSASKNVQTVAEANNLPCQPKATKVKSVNPLMAHYVQRLLGMSRNSINALGVSSSDIETPSSSIVNTTGNISLPETDITKIRLDRVQDFINDSYNLLSDLEESIKISNSSSDKEKTKIWKQQLKSTGEICKNVQKSKGDEVKEIKKCIKPILKNPLRPCDVQNKKTKLVENFTNQNDKKESKTSPTNQTNRYGQLSNNCSERIAELSDLINKVRQEKQKILEITLSSGSDNGKNTTEYLDFPKTIEKIPENYANEMNSKHEEEEVGTNETENLLITSCEPSTKLSDYQNPPVSLLNFGSELCTNNAPPHQLTTIMEVDTPAASRNNIIPAQNKSGTISDRCNDETSSNGDSNHPNIHYKEFPSLKSYLKKQSDNAYETNIHTVDSIESLLLTHLTIKEFPSINTYMAERETSPLNLLPLTSSDTCYNNDNNGQEDATTTTTKTTTTTTTSNNHVLDSSESFNIEEELLKRKILKKAFSRNIETKKDSLFLPSHDQNDPKRKKNSISFSSTSSTNSSNSKMKTSKTDDGDVKNGMAEVFQMLDKEEGQTLNLREFFTKELLKRTNTSSSTSATSSDNSFASVFLRSVLESIAPLPKTSTTTTNGNNRNSYSFDHRYKTSTPVVSFSSQSHSSSSPLFAHLFSGDSCISSVHSHAPSKDIA